MGEVDLEEQIDRVAQQFAESCRRGEQPSVSHFTQQHPEIADKLRELLPPIALVEQLKRRRERPAHGASSEPPGQIGEYRIVREVGRGGMGIVYEAYQQSLGRRVALKLLPRHSSLDPKRLGRFRREAQAAARLHHTNIVPVFGLFEHDGLLYYVMQFIEGQSLAQVLAALEQHKSAPSTARHHAPTLDLAAAQRSKAPQTSAAKSPAARPLALGGASGQGKAYWLQVAAMGVQVAEALNYAHEQDILHRDIKPANLLLDERGSVWVADFGLAKLLESDDLTATGDVIGTLQYMAPESLQGHSDKRSDIYSLGLSLYELLTLRAPYAETNPARLLNLITQSEPTRPRRLNPAIPRDLETIVLKATAREPSHRYPTAGALADDLRSFLDDRPIRARRVSAHERAWRWCRRNRISAALGAVALASMLLAGVIGWAGYVSTSRALTSESQRRHEAEVATERAESNMKLSLAALQDIFAVIAQQPSHAGEPLDPPADDLFGLFPLGPPPEQRGHREPPPPRGGPGGERDEPPPRKEELDVQMLHNVLQFYERFAQRNETDPQLQNEAAQGYARVGEIHTRLGENEEAAQSFARASHAMSLLATRFPDDPEYAANWIAVQLQWASLPGVEPPAEQGQRIEATLARSRSLAAKYPNNFEYRTLLARALRVLAMIQKQQGDVAGAEKNYRASIDEQRLIVEHERGQRRRLHELLATERSLAGLLADNGRMDDGKAVMEDSLARIDDGPAGSVPGPMMAEHCDYYAGLLRRMGKTHEADAMEAKARRLAEEPADGPRRRPPEPRRHGRGEPFGDDFFDGRPPPPRREPPGLFD